MKKVTHERRGVYVVIDAMDYAGKGTQIELLKKTLSQFIDTAIFTREPGGTQYAEKIRDVILDDTAKDADPYTEFLLFWAARNELVRDVIHPNLEAGRVIISDRADSSTWAYQLYGGERRMLEKEFLHQRRRVFNMWSPDLYVILDLPVTVALERARKDPGRVNTHFDKRVEEFHVRVRKGFQAFAQKFPSAIINADAPPKEVHKRVWKALNTCFPIQFPKI